MSTAITNVVEVRSDATLRVTRVTAIALGVAMAIFGLLAIPAIIDQWSYLSPVYSIATTVLAFALPIGLAFFASKMSLLAIRVALLLFGIVFLLADVLWPLALVIPMGVETQPWILTFTAIPTAAVALIGRALPAWLYTVVVAAADAVLRGFPYGLFASPRPLQDALFALMFSAIFTALILAVVERGRELDALTAVTRAEAAHAAALVAQSQESQRIDLLIHDDVMSTLLLASRGDPTLAEIVRDSARVAMTRLESRTHHEDETGDLGAQEFVAQLRAQVASISANVLFRVTSEHDRSIPMDVANAFATAVGESVRNSLAHAGNPASYVNRSVLVAIDSTSVRVVVDDDGVGFDVERGRRQSIGVAANIFGRMRQLPGGRARIRSSRGTGTRVDLSWVQQ
jgi:signal transduction histidine kinase